MSSMHRIGLLVPSSNTTMETEVPALLRARERARPEDTFSFHSARLRMEDVTPEGLRAMNEETGRATAELADLRPDVVATACLVAIMAQGPGSHRAAEAEIESILEQEHARAPVVSSAGALVDALHALGARRIGIVAPYLEELTRLVVAYIEDAGIEVGDAISLEVPRTARSPRSIRTTSKSTGSGSTCAAATRSSSRPACRCARSRCSRRWSAAAGCRRCPPRRRRRGRSCVRSTSSRSLRVPERSFVLRPNASCSRLRARPQGGRKPFQHPQSARARARRPDASGSS